MSASAPLPAQSGGDAAGPRDISRWRVGAIELDEATLELRLRGEPVAIERKPLELLMWLLRHPGEVITKEELFDSLWAGRVVTESVLTKCVAKLRQAIGDDAQAVLKTVHGFGYRLVAPVERLALHLEPAPAMPSALNPGDSPPQRPNWRLLRRYEGSRGENWLAEHAKSGEKRVFKFALDAPGLSQLKREITLNRLLRDTLGSRDDLVRVLDWNLDEAPYFVELDHCSQGSLVDWLGAQGGAGAAPPATRLELVAQTADALAAAHSAGVLHKDVKPGNVLIELDASGAPRVRLGDFGSGRVLDAERLQALEITRLGFTQTLTGDGSTSGTWAYLAPELVAGQSPTVRSDVFALGVLLYQLAVGDLKRPLAPGWERDLDDELLREDVAACCDQEPARRLGDAAELARRLRSLDRRRADATARQQAAAHAAALQEALHRSRTRRRWLSLVTGVASVGFVVTGGLFLQVRTSRDHAEQALDKAAREAAISQAVLAFLNEDVLGTASPYAGAGREPTVRAAVDVAAKRVSARFGEQPAVAAAVHAALGRVYSDLNEVQSAERMLGRAAELYRGEARDDTRLYETLISLSTNAWDNDRALAAVAIADEALEVARRIEPPDALRRAAAEGERAWVHYLAEDAQQGGQALETSYRHALGLGPPAAAVADTMRFRLARVHLLAGRYVLAEPLLREHLAHRLSTKGEKHLDTASAMRDLGTLLALMERFDESKGLLQRVLDIQLESFEPDQREVLDTRNEIATTHYRAGEFEQAESLWLALADASARRYGESFGITVGALGNAATSNRKLGRYDKALALAKRAVEAEARTPDVRPADALITRFKYAEALMQVGRATEALPLLEQIEREAGPAFESSSFWLGDFAMRRGEALAAMDRHRDARLWVQRAVDRYAQAEGIDEARIGEARRVLAGLEQRAGP